MAPTPRIEIRDLRQQDWLWTHKAVLFHPEIDGNTFKVYSGLASYANNTTQEAFPSIQTLATKLSISRMTVINAVAKLEKNKIIRVDRTEGEHNVYCLLAIGETASELPIVVTPKEQRPKDKAREFFDGVAALMRKEEVPWLQEFLRAFSERYSVPKSAVWEQVQEFALYWTERNGTGVSERWQMQKTFEVELRLMTWFRRAKVRERATTPSRGKGLVRATPTL